MENKKKLLQKTLKELPDTNNSNKEYNYIGTGNPNSKILIIGKEAAFEVETEQYQREIASNFDYWSNLADYDSKSIPERDISNYSPLYPYKGQVLKKDNKSNWGTSKTWYNYQKLNNFVFNKAQNGLIDFHENVFITEVNSTPSKVNANAIHKSIPYRKEHFLTSDFIQSFPIIIISGVGYFDVSENNNEIEQIFNVSFIEKKYARTDSNTQPYWIHWNKDKTKMVINTFQLSINIADHLLKEIAQEIVNSNLL